MDNDLINEDLMVFDMSELELDMEYYINFINVNKNMSGLYKIKRVFQNDVRSDVCVVTNIDESVEIRLFGTLNIINKRTTKHHPSRLDKILGYFTTYPYCATCNIYKLPPTEYVLK
jgi:hypothetical protein